MTETLKQNIGFSAIGSVGVQLIGLLSFVILARMLSPQEFGLIALVAVVTAVATMCIDMGIGSALIHRQEAGPEYYSTAFWLNLGLAFLLLLVLVSAAGTLAAFFQEPALENVILVSALLLPLNGAAVVPMARLQKQQKFRQVAIVELVSLLGGAIVAIALAFNGFGVWALVANLLAVALAKVVLLFVVEGWRPALLFDRVALVDMWSYSKHLIGASILNYAVEHVDRLLIARMINAASVGLYDNASRLLLVPVNLISTSLNRVIFPEYAKATSDLERKRAIHLKMIRLALFFALPFLLLVGLFSESLVVSLLGANWSEMAYILSILSLAYILRCIASLNGPVYLSEGRTGLLFKLTLFMRGNVLVAITLGMYLAGLPGLLWGLVIVRLVNFVPALYFPAKILGITLNDYVEAMGGTVVSSLLLYVIVFQYLQRGSAGFDSIMLLAVEVSLSLVVYLALSFFLNRKTLDDIVALMPARST